MAGTLGDLVVNIVANTKQFNKSIATTKKEVDNTEKGIKKTTTAIKGLVSGVVVAALVAKIGQVAQATIDAASDAEEAQAKFETAFSGIESRAEDVASALAKSYGLSNTESKTLLGSTGDLLKGFGATADEALDFSAEIQKLSVDLASYNNVQGGASRVSNILTKSVLGNKDGLSELGVSLLDVDIKQELVRTGQDKLTGQAGKLAKAQATYNLILKQTGDAQGDFERTSEGYANQLRVATARTEDLQVQLGKFLLPAATTSVGVFNELTATITEYISAFNKSQEIEKALKEGNATLEQKLSVLERQRDLEVDNFINIRKSEYATRQQIIAKDQEIAGINRAIEQVKAEIDEKNALAEAEKKAADLKRENERKEREAKLQLELLTAQELAAIEKIQEANKTDIEIIDEKIAKIEEFTTLDKEGRENQLEAIRILQEEKQIILDEEAEAKRQQLLRVQGDEEAYYEELDRLAQESREKRQLEAEEDRLASIANLEEELNFVTSTAGSIEQVWSNLNQTKINNIESEKEAAILALDEEVLGAEEYQKQKKEIENKAAEDAYNIRLEEFKSNRLLALSQIAIDTALGIAKVYGQTGIFGLAASIPVGIAGAAQAAIVLSQPAPAKPAFATGGVVTGATQAVVGEDRGEVLIGMGAKGQPLFNEMIDRLSEGISKQGGGITTNFYSMVNVSDPQQLRQFAQAYEPFAEEYREGRQ